MKEGTGTDLNENLCCSLCKSYLIDAVTLTECLHSYCRACLLENIEKNEECRCTKCACSFGKDLSEAFTRDEMLQKLVYKMVPDIYWQELERRGEFLKKRIVSPDEKALILDKKLIQLATELCAPNEVVSLCLEYISPGTPDNETRDEIEKETKPVDDSKPSTVAEADRWEKQESLMTSFKRYFRCPASTKISALRKLLEAKLEVLDTYRLYFVDTECSSTLDDQCTLQDIAYMFAWRRNGPMKILFTLQRHLEEEKPPVLDMEYMPELIAEEEPLTQGNTTVTAAIETSVQLPALTVSLNTSMMEGGANHQPIITTEVHPPPRKKRKPSSPTKKQQVASPAPVQRMTGISPLAKGPPPLVRPENSASGKKSSGGGGRTKSAEKASRGSHENAPPAKQAKLSPTSFDNKLQQIIGSTPSRAGKSTKGSRAKSASKASAANACERPVRSIASEESPDSLIAKTGNTNGNSQDMKVVSNGDAEAESGSRKEQGESSIAVKEKSPGKLHTISKITESTTSSSCSASVTSTSTTVTISHPRPIQPRPMEMKTNYEALVKSYALNGIGSKLSPFPMDGKHVGFSPAMHMQPPLFMDPKIAAQPIKHLLSGRGMPLMPETAPYLRNPTLANFMQHLHMQGPPIPGIPGASTPPLLPHTNSSQSPSPSSNQLTFASAALCAPTNSASSKGLQQLKLPVVPLPATPNQESNSKLLSSGSSRASSPTAKLQQKIASPIPIPTAHITPFMSHS